MSRPKKAEIIDVALVATVEMQTATIRRLRREKSKMRDALMRLYTHPPVRDQLAPIESVGSIRAQVEAALKRPKPAKRRRTP